MEPALGAWDYISKPFHPMDPAMVKKVLEVASCSSADAGQPTAPKHGVYRLVATWWISTSRCRVADSSASISLRGKRYG